MAVALIGHKSCRKQCNILMSPLTSYTYGNMQSTTFKRISENGSFCEDRYQFLEERISISLVFCINTEIHVHVVC